MNPAQIWPDFRDAWILHDDGDILVADKPEGVPSQSADPERPDDIVSRLRAHLGGAYLGVHQRLDQDTSGLLVFARRREANAALAAQFEGRRVGKTYIACVTGWRAGRDRTVLRGSIDRDPRRGGKAMRVSSGPGRDAKPAVTRVRLLGERGDRSMLELELETGRTHQARVQLADAGAPIAGDVLYGGAPAPRLMLHASAIELRHPSDQRLVRFGCPPPSEFDEWLARGDVGSAVFDDDLALTRALSRAVERRWGLGRNGTGPRATTAFRLANEEGDGLPRLAVDLYGGWLVAQLYADADSATRADAGAWGDPARRERVLDRIHALGFDGVYLKLRPKQANVLSRDPGARVIDLAPPGPVRGEASPEPLGILEEGMPLLVRLGDGLSTGLFLDQRNNRRRVRAAAAGKTVANLFAYTCGFTVAAVLGGARRTVSVDSSASALDRGRANLANAGAAGGDNAFVADDAFSWLERTHRRGDRFDFVVLDPPSYSTTKRGRFVADDDYTRLAAAAIAVLGPAGQLLACTNHRGISRARLRRILFDAGREAKRALVQVKDLPGQSDHPVEAGGQDHMKSALVSL